MTGRRIAAGIMALILAAVPVMGAAAEEVLIAEQPEITVQISDAAEFEGDVQSETISDFESDTQSEMVSDSESDTQLELISDSENDTQSERVSDFESNVQSDTVSELESSEQSDDTYDEFLDDDLILSAEIIETAPQLLTSETETESLTQTQTEETEETEETELEEEFWAFEGTVSSSGRAADAVYPRARIYGASVYENSYGGQLTGNAKLVYDGMVNAFVKQKSTETVYIQIEETLQYNIADQYEKADVAMQVDYMSQAAFDAFKYDYPEIYWLGLVSYGALVTKQTVDEDTICSVSRVRIIPKEDYSGSSAASEQSAFSSAVSSAVQSISASISSGSTTRDKVLAIHDYICSHVVYDENYETYASDDPQNAYIHSAAGVFLKGGVAVCEGYAKAFKILCSRFGVESELITGDALGGSHMWNYVKMDDGNWYLLDATWDDQTSGIIYTYFLAGSLDLNSYGDALWTERFIYSNFSPSDYTKTFAAPVLSDYSYDQNNPTHTHAWVLGDGYAKTPTCMEEGYEIYTCSCGSVTAELLSKTEHSFQNNTVYNNDATCVSNGTKTYYCDYGCGTQGKTVTASGTKLTPTYTVNATSLRLQKGQKTTKFVISGLGLGDYVKSWKSTKKSVVTVKGNEDGTCTIRAKKVGKAEIVAVLASKVEIRITVRVQKKAVQATKIQGVPKTLTLKKGDTHKLTPVVRPLTCKMKVTYSSSNTKVATVTKNGKIRAKKKGKTVITVTCGSVTKKCRVTVTKV